MLTHQLHLFPKEIKQLQNSSNRAQMNNQCAEPTTDQLKVCFNAVRSLLFDRWKTILIFSVLTCIVVNILFGNFTSGIPAYKEL